MRSALDETLPDNMSRNFAFFQDSPFGFLILFPLDMPANLLIGLPDEDFFIGQAIIVEEGLTDAGKTPFPVFPEEFDIRIMNHGLPQEAEIRLPGRFQFVDAKRSGQYGQQALAVPRRFPCIIAAAQQNVILAIGLLEAEGQKDSPAITAVGLFDTENVTDTGRRGLVCLVAKVIEIKE